jgi:hypothetical protein
MIPSAASSFLIEAPPPEPQPEGSGQTLHLFRLPGGKLVARPARWSRGKPYAIRHRAAERRAASHTPHPTPHTAP